MRLFSWSVAMLLSVTGCSSSSSSDTEEAPAPAPTAEASPPPSGGGGTQPPPTPTGETPPKTEPPAPAKPAYLRVMSYNIKTGSESSLAAIAAAITTEKPDLVGLQEVDELTNRSNKVAQTAELAKLTKLPHAYFGANFDFDGGKYGLAVLSKTPLVNPRVIRMDKLTQRANGYEPRIAVAAETVVGGKTITFVTMHASLHEEERAGNAKAVLDALGPNRAPTIITGDMNETPKNAIGNAFIAAGMVDAHAEKSGNPLEGLTAPATFPTRRIDMAYKDKAFGKTQFSWVPSTTASDHRPVMVTFDSP